MIFRWSPKSATKGEQLSEYLLDQVSRLRGMLVKLQQLLIEEREKNKKLEQQLADWKGDQKNDSKSTTKSAE